MLREKKRAPREHPGHTPGPGAPRKRTPGHPGNAPEHAILEQGQAKLAGPSNDPPHNICVHSPPPSKFMIGIFNTTPDHCLRDIRIRYVGVHARRLRPMHSRSGQRGLCV
jgi:hypothetical protein